MIHVCFGLHDKTGRYSKFTGTTMLSIFKNTKSKVTVHILHDNTLSPDNRDKFSYVAGQYNQLVKFYNVEELCADKLAEYVNLVPYVKNSKVTVGAFYRLLIAKILFPQVEKIIYFDSDIIVNTDILELWQIELNDKSLAAVPRFLQCRDDVAGLRLMKDFALVRLGLVKDKDYFNSGVLIINLRIFYEAESHIVEGLKFRGKYPKWTMFDQEVLNYCFASRALKLPVKFNLQVGYERTTGDKKVSKKIYHFTRNNSAWSFNLDMNDPFSRLWMHYFMKTPWFDEETLGRLYAECQQTCDNLYIAMTNSMRELTALMSGKTRVFFILQNYLDFVAENFSVKDDEEVIIISYDSPMEKLIGIMNESRGKKVFFIMAPNFPFDLLIQADFVPGKDFLNGFEFFATEEGLPLNSYRLIQAM